MLSSISTIKDRVSLFLDSTSDPPVKFEEVDILLDMAKRVDLFGNPPDNYEEWDAEVSYAIGDTVVPRGKVGTPAIPLIRTGFYYVCSIAGRSGTSEPAWPVVLTTTVVDGAATWNCTGVAPWNPTYDVNYAIAQGWLLKAGRLAGHYNFMSGGKMLSREQFYEHCMKQYRLFSNKSGIKSVRLGMHEFLGSSARIVVPTNTDG